MEALAAAYGVHRVGDLAEMADTLELFALRSGGSPRRRLSPASPHPDDPTPPNPIPGSHTRPPNPTVRTGIATVHDSGLERAHVADVADELGCRSRRSARRPRPGWPPCSTRAWSLPNPLDVWGTGTRAQEQLTGSLAALADDPAVRAVALAVDLVHEFDGDDSYPAAAAETARRTSKPVVVLSNVPAAIDPDTAAGLRASGIPVLEGTRSGLLALKHLLDHDFPAHGQATGRLATLSGRRPRRRPRPGPGRSAGPG